MAPRTFTTHDCIVIKSVNQILMPDFKGAFPEELNLQSHKTGRVVKCKLDRKSALRNKFWGGELAEYIPEVVIAGFNKLVITH